MQLQSNSYNVSQRYSCNKCGGLVNKSIYNNNTSPKPFALSNPKCSHNLVKDKIQSNDDNIRFTCTMAKGHCNIPSGYHVPKEHCSKCGIPVIKNVWDNSLYRRDDNTACAQCGIKRKDHYTYQHSFRPLKADYCGQSTMSPFDPTPRDVPGYDPLDMQYYPPSGLNEDDPRQKCGNKFYPHS